LHDVDARCQHSASQVANWTGVWTGSGEMHALFAAYLEMICDLRAQCVGDRLPLSSGDGTRYSLTRFSLLTDFGATDFGVHTAVM
jgi:hypothetical protein